MFYRKFSVCCGNVEFLFAEKLNVPNQKYVDSQMLSQCIMGIPQGSHGEPLPLSKMEDYGASWEMHTDQGTWLELQFPCNRISKSIFSHFWTFFFWGGGLKFFLPLSPRLGKKSKFSMGRRRKFSQLNPWAIQSHPSQTTRCDTVEDDLVKLNCTRVALPRFKLGLQQGKRGCS